MALSKEQGIVAAVIGAIATIIVAYWQFVYKPAQSETAQFTGRVIDANTEQPIRGAKVSVETQGVPQVYHTDSEGVFYVKLSGSTDTIRIKVTANGYDLFDRNISISRTGVEDIRLISVKSTSLPISEALSSMSSQPSPTISPSLRGSPQLAPPESKPSWSNIEEFVINTYPRGTNIKSVEQIGEPECTNNCKQKVRVILEDSKQIRRSETMVVIYQLTKRGWQFGK